MDGGERREINVWWLSCRSVLHRHCCIMIWSY